MKITHICVSDSDGGAARSAYRVHTGLRRIGLSSSMLVLEKRTGDPDVRAFDVQLAFLPRALRFLRQRSIKLSQKELSSRPEGASFFSDDRSPYGADVLRQLPETNIVHLHWVAGFLGYEEFFSALPQDVPVVWTLHDMNPFTGGCHFDGGCGRFVAECGCCPELQSSQDQDFSRRVWRRKAVAFAKVRRDAIHLVTPSQWLAAEVRRSKLLGQFACDVIPYGIDVEVFQPRDRAVARARFGISPDAKVVLFIADWAGEKRKGLSCVLSAFEGLLDIPDLFLVAAGRRSGSSGSNPRIRFIDYIRDDQSMSQLYSCADIFVVPSLQDNLPNTALEAISCGAPIVGFAVGGLVDIVRDGKLGRLVPAGDIEQLRTALRDLIDDSGLRKTMSSNGREIAVREYALEVQAERYRSLYASLLRP